MTEVPQPYNIPTQEEIDSLLLGDFGVDEAAPNDKVMEVGDRAESSKVMEVGDRANYENLVSVISDIIDTYFDISISTELAEEIIQELEAMGWKLCQVEALEVGDRPDESSKVMEVRDHPGTTSEVLEEGENFIRPIVPKAWLPGVVYIDLYDDGWEVRQHPDPSDEDISQSDWTADKNEELTMLRRIKNELAGSLQKIYIYADQIETNNQALLENSFDDDEQRGVEIMDRYLAAQIKVYIRRHLKINLEVTSYDILY
jgi:hypothetical protein